MSRRALLKETKNVRQHVRQNFHTARKSAPLATEEMTKQCHALPSTHMFVFIGLFLI